MIDGLAVLFIIFIIINFVRFAKNNSVLPEAEEMKGQGTRRNKSRNGQVYQYDPLTLDELQALEDEFK